jgi:hypothetical protein
MQCEFSLRCPHLALSQEDGITEWPARSPNLNACDFFLWGYLWSKVYEKRPRTTEDMKENISNEVAAFSPIMLQRVMQKFQKGLWKYVATLDATSETLQYIQEVNFVLKML